MDEWILDDEVETFTSAGAPQREQRRPPEIPGELATAIRRSADHATQARKERLVEQMAKAAEAFDRHRFEEAARLANRLAEEVPDVPEVQELAGLASYRDRQWRGARKRLSTYRMLRGDPQYLPLEMDSARALGRTRAVDELFEELRQASPGPDVLAEGRMVLAGSLADRGKLTEAIELLQAAGADKPRRNPAERHLRQWYLLGDLYDRSGDVPRARALFTMVARVDPTAYDVGERLGDLGMSRAPRRTRPRKRSVKGE